MSRITTPTRDEAPAASQPTLERIGKQLGFIPNLHRILASSPAVLAGFVQLQTALSKTLDAKTRHAISLAVSQVNSCEYCLTAHTYAATQLGKMEPHDVALCREGDSTDPKRAAAAR